MNINKISSLSLFTNDRNNNKAVFAINFEGGRELGINIKLNEVKTITGSTIKGTHPIGQNPITSVLSRRAGNVKSLLVADTIALDCYTGRYDVAGMSISVDVIRTAEQVVASIIFGNTENTRLSRTIAVAFTEVHCVRSGSQFEVAVWGKKEAASGVLVKNMNQDIDTHKTADGVEIVEQLVAAGNIDALALMARAVLHGMKALQDKADAREVAAQNAIDNGFKDEFQTQFEQLEKEIKIEVAPTIATEIDNPSVYVEVKNESHKVSALALSQEELEEQEREREEIEAEARRAALMQRRRDQNKREGVGAALVQELEQKRLKAEENDMIEAYQIDQIHEYSSVIGRARETFY